MGEAVRIQLKRTKGWRMPPNTVKVTRPGPWGNPFSVHPQHEPGRVWNAHVNGGTISVPTVADAVACFREMMEVAAPPGTRGYALRQALPSLRGKNLACWCRLGDPCHADVLLELANRPVCDTPQPAALARTGDDQLTGGERG